VFKFEWISLAKQMGEEDNRRNKAGEMRENEWHHIHENLLCIVSSPSSLSIICSCPFQTYISLSQFLLLSHTFYLYHFHYWWL